MIFPTLCLYKWVLKLFCLYFILSLYYVHGNQVPINCCSMFSCIRSSITNSFTPRQNPANGCHYTLSVSSNGVYLYINKWIGGNVDLIKLCVCLSNMELCTMDIHIHCTYPPILNKTRVTCYELSYNNRMCVQKYWQVLITEEKNIFKY